jgi:hypothetical protein
MRRCHVTQSTTTDLVCKCACLNDLQWLNTCHNRAESVGRHMSHPKVSLLTYVWCTRPPVCPLHIAAIFSSINAHRKKRWDSFTGFRTGFTVSRIQLIRRLPAKICHNIFLLSLITGGRRFYNCAWILFSSIKLFAVIFFHPTIL